MGILEIKFFYGGAERKKV